MVIVLSALRLAGSGYPFDIDKLFYLPRCCHRMFEISIMFLLVVNTVYVILLLLITCKLKRVYIEMAAICCTYHIFIDKVKQVSDLFTNIAGETILNFLKEINLYYKI